MQFKLSHEVPEIYEKLHKIFGVEWDNGLMIAYGDTVYCKTKPSEDELEHEYTHLLQQKRYGGPEKWFERYIQDSSFRLEQEIEAYRAQARYAKDKNLYSRQVRRDREKSMSKFLSGPMYGNLIKANVALEMIKA